MYWHTQYMYKFFIPLGLNTSVNADVTVVTMKDRTLLRELSKPVYGSFCFFPLIVVTLSALSYSVIPLVS